MSHIKRDGKFLCLQRQEEMIYYLYRHGKYIRFPQAHKLSNFDNICEDCCKRYFEILGRLKKPLQV